MSDDNGAQPTGADKNPTGKWDDPSIPVGNAPPLPRWPLAVAALAWLGWVIFLVVMMLERLRSPAV